MTISIVETVTNTAASVTFTEVLQSDVALVVMKWVDDGSNLSGVTFPGWANLMYTGTGCGIWRELTAGETSTTFATEHVASIQLIAALLRSDVYNGLAAVVDEFSNGLLTTTDFADDPVMAFSGSETFRGSFTGMSFVLLAEMPNCALWRHSPLQVPLGTTVQIIGTGDTNLGGAVAWRPWTAAYVAPAVAVGGWTNWIID